jgi:perosamine synthetase
LVITAPVPFYRPELQQPEIDEVVATLRSGWLTTGPRVKRFETEFATAVRASHAVGLNSCTAALHVAVKALGLRPGDGVLVPTMTFAATAEVVRYEGAIPILVDCDPVTLNVDLAHAEQTIQRLQTSALTPQIPAGTPVVGIMPVHVAGMMANLDEIRAFAQRHRLWVVEDAAHAFPAAWRRRAEDEWQWCGQNTAEVTCFSFYANKTITTGEGGMAVTADAALADRIRLLSLHGLSADAWGRYSGTGSWDYRIVEAGYKYNLTDVAAAIGIHQLARAEEMRRQRQAIAEEYLIRLADIDEIELPPVDQDRIHAWHLFPIRLRLEALTADRNDFMKQLAQEGVGCSVHWRPLHLHPYHEQTFAWRESDLPVASEIWKRLVSLPLFSAMRREEIETVIATVRTVCQRLQLARYA